METVGHASRVWTGEARPSRPADAQTRDGDQSIASRDAREQAAPPNPVGGRDGSPRAGEGAAKGADASEQTFDPRWALLAARDRSADGAFWYSVETTGVYCRPSCSSRRANPRNVRFHATLAEAQRTGFRPCKRCRPDEASLDAPDPAAALVARACRWLEEREGGAPLDTLARALGVGAGRLHRLFKAQTGLTPKAFAQGLRAARVRDGLREGGKSVTAAFHEAGFGSSGRFYEAAGAALGMTPSRFRAKGEGETIRFAVGQSSLGAILVASSEKGVAAILMGDEPDALARDLQRRFARATIVGADTDYERVVAAAVGLVEEPAQGLDLPLDLRGTVFQQRVWQALRAIPPGQTTSYAALAEAVGHPAASRAVAGACAANPLAVAIPCHRVVRRNGALSGYAWGVERKQALLERERADPTTPA